MEYVTTTLSNNDLKDLEFLGDFYGEADKGKLLKLALRNFVKEHFASDVTEEGE